MITERTPLAMTSPDTAALVTSAELDAVVAQLRSLDSDDWNRPTPCEGWTVRDIAAHVAGALEEAAKPPVFQRHNLAARAPYPQLPWIDAMTRQQVAERADRTPGQLVAEIAEIGAAAIATGRRLPRPARAVALPDTGALPPGSTLAYLTDVIRARDLWMHRIDIAVATGRDLAGAAGEGEVVTQVVRDLDLGWEGPTSTLTLTGHGAGTWQLGHRSPEATLTADAVETCRMLSGRDATPTITCTGDPRAELRLRSARVLF